MLAVVILLVCVALGAFICFLLTYRAKRETMQYYNAAEQIVREELLDYSLRNPYTREHGGAPPARRVMLGVELLSARPQRKMLFDPARSVYVGRSDKNQIVLYDAAASARHICMQSWQGAVWLRNESGRSTVYVHRGWLKKIAVAPGKALRLHDCDQIRINQSRLRVRLFDFDNTQKLQIRRKA